MSENHAFKYLSLGEPPLQPRKTRFVPRKRNGRDEVIIGKAKVLDKLQDEINLVPRNAEMLRTHECKQLSDQETSHGSQDWLIKAGDVIISAKPFVLVPATG